MQFLIKTVVSSLIIALFSELSKRSNYVAAILISLPITSMLALSWLYVETHDVRQVSDLSLSIFWLVLPSLGFFILLAKLLNMGLPYWTALCASVIGTAVLYGCFNFFLNRMGIKI